MSQVYATEPATSGRVVLDTTHGSIELNLWCRECPKTTRYFLQLCVDGFFDNMAFHRIVPDFLIQTGAVRTGSSHKTNIPAPEEDKAYREAVEADEALQRRKYEVHSRLRFNHRGQVAMALGVSDEDDVEFLQPQFFITLEEAPYLDGKHVLFGTVSGPTIFNAIRIGRTNVDEETKQPVDMEDAPRIRSVKIVENTEFSDLKALPSVPWKKVATDTKKKKKKRKGKKDVNVLSFGDELEDAGESSGLGMQSSHDVVVSETLSKRVDEQVQQAVAAETEENNSRPKKRAKKQKRSPDSEAPAKAPTETVQVPEIKPSMKSRVEPPRNEVMPKSDVKTPKEKQSAVEPQKKAKKGMSAVEARRAKYKTKGSTSKNQREQNTMKKLFAFQRKVRGSTADSTNGKNSGKDNSLAARMARKVEASSASISDLPPDDTYRGQVLESDDEETGKDWLNTKFKCRNHMDIAARGADALMRDQLGSDGRNMDDYVVVDEGESGGGEKRHRKKHHKKNRHRH